MAEVGHGRGWRLLMAKRRLNLRQYVFSNQLCVFKTFMYVHFKAGGGTPDGIDEIGDVL